MKQKFFVKLAVISTALGLTFGLNIPSASALSGAQFEAGRIMDDAIFFNPSTMSVGNIQTFLNSKVPVCETNHASSDPANQPPFTCLKDYRQNTPAKGSETNLCSGISAGNRSAAEIIFDVSHSCGVNPQTLLVLLQKEQSLVTDTWPWNIQYRSATGYGCPDTAPCDAEYYGFFNQVYHAARQFKRYVRDANLFNYRAGFNNYIQYNPNAACGGSTVYIQNRTTAGLYNYTPYQPNVAALNNLYGAGDGCSAHGNRNFWRIFNDWFGPTFGTVLLKGSGPTVYLRGSNPDVAYPIASGDLLKAYGLQNTPVTGVSDGYLALMNTSTLLTTLFKNAVDPNTIFLADSGKAYGLPSGAVCDKWGLPCSTPSQVSAPPLTVTSLMPTGPPLGNLMVFDNRLFVMESARKRPFIDSNEKSISAWSGDTPTVIGSPLNSGQLGGNAIIYGRRFFKPLAGGGIYYHSNGQYFTFSSFDGFKSWYDNSGVIEDKYSTFNTTPPSTTLLPSFASDISGLYLVNGINKVLLPSSPSGGILDITSTPNIASLFNAKSSLNAASSDKVLRIQTGTMFSLSGGSLRPIPSLTDFGLQFSAQNVVNVNSSVIGGYPIGKLLIPNGRIIKPNGGSTIYLLSEDKKLWSFTNLTEVNSSLQWVNNVISGDLSDIDYTSIHTYNALIKFSSNYYAVQSDGKARLLPTAALNSYKDDLSTQIGLPVSARIPIDGRNIQFIRSDNGVIFAVDGSSIRPISSFATYISLGGTGNNTLEVPSRAITAFTIGSLL